MTAPVQDSIFDQGRLTELKRLTSQNSPEATKAVAKQFESLFLQMMLKQMRQSVTMGGSQTGYDGEQVNFYRGLADQQLAVNLAKSGGIGLAKAIERQLAPKQGVDTAASDGTLDTSTMAYLKAAGNAASTASAARGDGKSGGNGNGNGSAGGSSSAGGASSFIGKIWNAAVDAAKSLGVPTQFIVGHAALETGWGRSELKMPDGSSSYNLFNIKAGSDWKGPTVEASTLEYIGGVPTRKVERFRAYSSYSEAFADYARLIGNNSRYASAVGQTDARGFAGGLARGGYATDPMYADKLTRIIGGKTLRTALASDDA
jgi:flagellar protein FlgJ